MKTSIVIRALNSEKTIAKCLENVLRQKKPEGTEVLVVFDLHSTDNTLKVLQKFGKKIRIEEHSMKGFANALNFGVQKAKGELIVFCDDDMFVSENWLAELLRPLKGKNADAVSGPVLPLETNFFGKCVSAMGYPGGGFKRLFDEGFTQNPTMNIAMKRRIFEKTGSFDEKLVFGNEDTDFFQRALKKGFKFWFNPKATVRHRVRDNLPEFIKWWVRRGKADLGFHKKHMPSYPWSLLSPKSSRILRLLAFLIITALLSFNALLEAAWLLAVIAWIVFGIAREQREYAKIKKFLRLHEIAYWTAIPALVFLGKITREFGRILGILRL